MNTNSYINLLNSAIIIVCSPGTDAEVHLKVSLILSTAIGFDIIKVLVLCVLLSIRTSPFILPLFKMLPFSDHTISEGKPSPVNPHRKQRGLLSGRENTGIGLKMNSTSLWGHSCPFTSLTTIYKERYE